MKNPFLVSIQLALFKIPIMYLASGSKKFTIAVAYAGEEAVKI